MDDDHVDDNDWVSGDPVGDNERVDGDPIEDKDGIGEWTRKTWVFSDLVDEEDCVGDNTLANYDD